MHTFMVAVLVVQVITFAALGVAFCLLGEWRLGIAQVLLAAVQAVIYSGGLK